MKGYTFRLGTVLRVRHVEVLMARQRVGVAARMLSDAAVRERRLTAEYEASIGSADEIYGAGFIAAFESGHRLAAMVATSVAGRVELQQRLVAERLEALRAERRVAVLERLDDRRRREWLTGVQRETSRCSTTSPRSGQRRDRLARRREGRPAMSIDSIVPVPPIVAQIEAQLAGSSGHRPLPGWARLVTPFLCFSTR